MWHKNVLLCHIFCRSAGALQRRVSLHCSGNWASRPHARLPLLGPFPFRHRRARRSPRPAAGSPPRSVSPVVHRVTDPQLPVTPIRRGIHVCSLHLCLYFCSANKATHKMVQTFQFSHHDAPATLFQVRTCRAFHLSCDSPRFSMEIVCIFVKFPTFDFSWVEILVAKTPSLSTPEMKFYRTWQYPHWGWRILNFSSTNDSATDAEHTSKMSDD